MPKRGINIYKRKDGRWEGRIKTEDTGGGIRRYRSVYGRTYAEVKKRMECAKTEGLSGAFPGKHTMGEALNLWLEERKGHWKETTYATYEHIAHKYVFLGLGNVRLAVMDEMRMEKFIADIGRECGLSDSYKRNICAVVVRAMKYIKRRYRYAIEIPQNVVPSKRHRERRIPGEGKLAILERYLTEQAREGDATCLGILIVLCMGLRIGEICALTWENINLEEEVVCICQNLQRVKINDGQKNSTRILVQTPKTGCSRRTIPIPPCLLALLQKQAAEGYLIKGKRKPWAEPRTLQYRFAGILKKCGLENFNFHLLRHAFATRCITKGFDVKSLSEILGHSDIQITLNLYVHSTMQRKKQLMERFEDCLYSND